MATAATRPQRQIIEFPPNVPVEVSLKYAQGRLLSTQYGERMMFSLTDGRVMFLHPQTAGKIEAAGINVNERFQITRLSNGDAPMTWAVTRIPGEQPNGTLVVPIGAAAPDGSAPAPKPPASATAAERRQVAPLVAEGKALVDAYAEVLGYALNTYEGRIKPDEVKSLFVTSYIQRGKSAA